MKGLRVFGHPLHAVLSDVPVGLLGTSLVWDAVGLWRGEPVWWAISFWAIALGLAVAAAAATASPRAMAQKEIAHQTGSPRQRPTASHTSDVPSSPTGTSLRTACSGWPKTRKPFIPLTRPP